ncbi:MAG: hypothetical protein SX243_16255 [Acidobacteriota bacterium]|nr:hypothetical protein [Acidobacteriota bacterium]
MREGLGPPSKQARREAALRGLVFEHGRVRVDPGVAVGETEGRLAEAARAVREAPARPEPLAELGWELVRIGWLEHAEAALRTALDIDPGRWEIRAELAKNLQRQGRYPLAAEEWRRILAARPEDGRAHSRLAMVLYLAEDPEGAHRHLAEAQRLGISLDGSMVPAHFSSLLADGGAAVWKPTLGSGLAPFAEGAAVSIGPQRRVDAGGGKAHSNESSIAGLGNELVAAWNDERDPGDNGEWSLGVGVSLDGGATWKDFLMPQPGAEPGTFQGDPMTAYDPRTGNLWAGGISFFGETAIYVARKAPGASSFGTPVILQSGGFLDKGWMVAGRGPVSANTTRLYVAYNLGLQTSSDLGATWSTITPLDAAGVGFHPRLGPGGELYITYWDFDVGVKLYRSFDGGATLLGPTQIATRMDTWGTQDGSRFPGLFRVANLNWLAVDPNDGSLYCVFHDTTQVVSDQSDVDIYLIRSTDQGATWSTPQIVNGDANPPGDQFHPWIEVDAAGRVHLLYFDTRHTAQMDDVEHGMIDVYYAVSLDQGATFSEYRLTAAPFDSADAVWAVGGQFVGDYLGAVSVVDSQGEALQVLYPTAENGDLDLWNRRIAFAADPIFTDGFESGDTNAWSARVP